MKLGCVLLAAGSSKRFGSDKLLYEINGEPMALWSIRALPLNMFYKVVAVVKRGAAAELFRREKIETVINDRPQDGAGLSVRLGTERMLGTDAVMFMVCDQPYLKKESIVKLIDRFISVPDMITALGDGENRGNPIIYPAKYFGELMRIEGDNGGREVIKAHPEDLFVLNAAQRVELMDVDTREAELSAAAMRGEEQ